MKRPEYSYNWPYDYFSILDMAKIEANVHSESPDARDFRRLQNELVDLPIKPTEVIDERILRNLPEAKRIRSSFLTNTDPVPLTTFVPILEFPEATVITRTPIATIAPIKVEETIDESRLGFSLPSINTDQFWKK